MQAAYDTSKPNGSGRRELGDRVLYIFRVYRKRQPIDISVTGEDPTVSTGRRTIMKARAALDVVAQSISPVEGLVLEKEFRFPLILEAVDERTEIRSSFTYTQDSWFLDVPFRNARGVTHWRMHGRTFWTPVYVNGIPVDGDSALKEFKEIVEEIAYPQDGMPAEYELYWLNLNAPISSEDPFGEFEWRIWPAKSGVQTKQNAVRPFQRMWSFEFMGLSSNKDRAKAEDGFLAGMMSRGTLERFLNAVNIGTVTDVLDEVFGTLDEVQGLIDDSATIITAATDYVQGAERAIKTTFAKVRGTMRSMRELIAKVEDGVRLAGALPDVFGEQLELLRSDYEGLVKGPAKGRIAVRELQKLSDCLACIAAQPQNFAQPVAYSLGAQSITVRVKPRVTLESIASEANVDAQAIIEANQLRYPYIDDREHPERKVTRIETEIAWHQAKDDERVANGLDPRYAEVIADLQHALTTAQRESDRYPALEGVLYPGDEILIPQQHNDVLPSIIGMPNNRVLSLTGREERVLALTGVAVTTEDRIFGIDLLLNENGDMEWDADRKDFMLSRGLGNMVYALERYMRLRWGGLRYAPGVGNYAYDNLAQWQGPGRNRLLAYAVCKTLRQDPRVKNVRNVRAETYMGRAQLVFDAELISGQAASELRVGV